jgi:hypothetical protein
MAQNRTCNLSITGRPSSPLRHVFQVPPDALGSAEKQMILGSLLWVVVKRQQHFACCSYFALLMLVWCCTARRRGYRLGAAVHKAALNEAAAAGLLLLAGWRERSQQEGKGCLYCNRWPLGQLGWFMPCIANCAVSLLLNRFCRTRCYRTYATPQHCSCEPYCLPCNLQHSPCQASGFTHHVVLSVVCLQALCWLTPCVAHARCSDLQLSHSNLGQLPCRLLCHICCLFCLQALCLRTPCVAQACFALFATFDTLTNGCDATLLSVFCLQALC